jgi:AraC family transcriptional regulator
MYREFQRRDDLTVLTLEGMLLELLAEMARDTVSLVGKEAPHWLRQATDFLHAHFTQSLTTEMIASAVGVHPAHLMRSFRQRYHCTIGEYVRRLRVEYACHLLATSHSSLGQIAFEAGFADQSHFNHTFKGYMGISPKEFQRISGGASPRQKTHF